MGPAPVRLCAPMEKSECPPSGSGAAKGSGQGCPQASAVLWAGLPAGTVDGDKGQGPLRISEAFELPQVTFEVTRRQPPGPRPQPPAWDLLQVTSPWVPLLCGDCDSVSSCTL